MRARVTCPKTCGHKINADERGKEKQTYQRNVAQRHSRASVSRPRRPLQLLNGNGSPTLTKPSFSPEDTLPITHVPDPRRPSGLRFDDFSVPYTPTSLARTPTPPTMAGELPSPVTERVNGSPKRGPEVYPGPPWIHWDGIPGIPTSTVNDDGQVKALPYASFREVLGHSLQVGTEGMGCQTYSRGSLAGAFGSSS